VAPVSVPGRVLIFQDVFIHENAVNRKDFSVGIFAKFLVGDHRCYFRISRGDDGPGAFNIALASLRAFGKREIPYFFPRAYSPSIKTAMSDVEGWSSSIVGVIKIPFDSLLVFEDWRAGSYPNIGALFFGEIIAGVSQLYPESAERENGEEGQNASENRHPIWSLRHFGWCLIFVAGFLYCFAMWCIGINRESVRGRAPLNSRWLIFAGLIVMVLATLLAGHALRLTLAAKL
jgi:hypothetical protein